jgi:lia operon protein LiaG
MPFIRLLPLAAFCAAPLAAQNRSHHTLRGPDVALYNLAGVIQIEAGAGDLVAVDVSPGGPDLSRLRVVDGELDGRTTLRVIYPGDWVQYPPMGDGSTELRVRDDGTFDGDGHDDAGRRVRISNRPGGIEAWADLRVAVPAGRTLSVHLAVGRLTVTNVDGRLRLQTANAPVTVNGARGGLDVEVGSGAVQLSATEGDLRVSTGSGHVQLTRARGRALSIETGSGDVAASGLEADELAVQSGSGDVRVTAAKAPRVGLETGSGTVTVELQGGVARLDVNTGSGDIAITAPPTLSARLEIETASGEIDSDFPLTVTRSGRDHLRGTVGDGKGKISVETGSGRIRLLKARS